MAADDGTACHNFCQSEILRLSQALQKTSHSGMLFIAHGGQQDVKADARAERSGDAFVSPDTHADSIVIGGLGASRQGRMSSSFLCGVKPEPKNRPSPASQPSPAQPSPAQPSPAQPSPSQARAHDNTIYHWRLKILWPRRSLWTRGLRGAARGRMPYATGA